MAQALAVVTRIVASAPLGSSKPPDDESVDVNVARSPTVVVTDASGMAVKVAVDSGIYYHPVPVTGV